MVSSLNSVGYLDFKQWTKRSKWLVEMILSRSSFILEKHGYALIQQNREKLAGGRGENFEFIECKASNDDPKQVNSR
jgi:hypothetical protein